MQVTDPEVAASVVESLRGITQHPHGTGKRLKDGCTDQYGRKYAIDFKTGTNDESKTSGLRGGTATGIIGLIDEKTKKIDYRFSFSISGYIQNASVKDKFTSGTAAQGLMQQCENFMPMIARAYPLPNAVSQPTLPASTPAPAIPANENDAKASSHRTVQSLLPEFMLRVYHSFTDTPATPTPVKTYNSGGEAAILPERRRSMVLK